MSTIHVSITFIKLSIISLLIGPAVKCLMTERKNAVVFVVRYHSLSFEESHLSFSPRTRNTSLSLFLPIGTIKAGWW